MSETPDHELPVPSQPDYVALDATAARRRSGRRSQWSDGTRTRTRLRADDMREAEAGDVAATVARVIAEGWSVRRRRRRLAAGPSRRHHRSSCPARTSLPFLQDALEDRKHPAPRRVELPRLRHPSGARPAHGAARGRRPDQRDAPRRRAPHTAARLWRRRPVPLQGRAPGPLEHLADQPDTVPADDPVLAGVAYLRGLYEDRQWCAPSELLDRIVRDRRAFELGFGEGRPRDVWRRLRFVIDQARGVERRDRGKPAAVPALGRDADAPRAAGSREAILPETDDDAVRIMTIHAAKGLEFPITIVSGMSTAPSGQYAPAEVAFPPTARRRATASAGSCRPRSGRSGSPSTSRWASTSASASSTSRARGRATTSSCRCTARSGSRRRSRTRARTPSC